VEEDSERTYVCVRKIRDIMNEAQVFVDWSTIGMILSVAQQIEKS